MLDPMRLSPPSPLESSRQSFVVTRSSEAEPTMFVHCHCSHLATAPHYRSEGQAKEREGTTEGE
jgi:hypothetical protein